MLKVFRKLGEYVMGKYIFICISFICILFIYDSNYSSQPIAVEPEKPYSLKCSKKFNDQAIEIKVWSRRFNPKNHTIKKRKMEHF
jgi:hypothetical protein